MLMKHCIPMMQVRARKSAIHNIPRKMYYPLYKNYNEEYNYSNIKDSICKWNSYAESVSDSVDKMLELFTIVNNHGSIVEIEECTKLLTNNILSLKEYEDYITVIKNTDGTNTIIEHLHEAQLMDRLIENHNYIMKRFDVDSYIINNSTNIESTIYKICEFIDTYNMGIDSKYKICLEEIQYLLEKHNIQYPLNSIYENITDYFLMNCLNEDDKELQLLDIMESVIDKNIFVYNKDYITYLKDLKDSKDIMIDEAVEESRLSKMKKAISKFKMATEKTATSFKHLIMDNLLVINTAEDMADCSVNILSVAFYCIVITGAIATNAWLGIVAAIVSKFINFHAEYKYYERNIKIWENNKIKAEKELNKTKNSEKKKDIEEYIKGLNKGISAMKRAVEDMKDDEEDNDSIDNDEFKLEEETLLKTINAFNSINYNSKNNKLLLNPDVFIKLDENDIKYIVDFASKYEGYIPKHQLKNTLLETANILRKTPDITNYKKISILNHSASILSNDNFIQENINYDELYSYTESINNFVLHELSIANSISLAIDKVSSKIADLDAGQQTISNSIDSTARRISRAIDNAFNSESRERIIRGDILPSMSRMIKIILASGIMFWVNPFIAALYLVIRLVLSKKASKRERQLVLNELDVELIMIDKYIRQAEEKNDLKKVKELLLIKKKLQTQYTKLKYHMTVTDKEIDTNDLAPKDED